MSAFFVGIDTSNYTTSVGIVDENGKVIANIKKLLPVASGECGLRQSDAVFAHIKNLPEVLAKADEVLCCSEVKAVGYSSRPRNVEGSYMPCFLCGVDTALAFKTGRGIDAYAFSHQCGHISAALTSADAWNIADEKFIAFHVSGGTTEVLLCKRGDDGFDTEIVGGTRDLSAGQAIDRAGVMMGMGFPCGAELEKEAEKYTAKIQKAKISVKDAYCNLSGLQNLSSKVYKDTNDKSATSAFVLDFVARTLHKMAEDARESYGDMPIVFGGGVMSNKRIRNMLETLGNVCFAEPALSSDNAVGIAELARQKYFKNR
ncbi:MAG: peptidase M22 [Clostridia bacterium]|nr:peptidase M22 [Clostridia bacterium]